MYLSNKQHSQLRTLVMNFEIPYRTFVAMELLNNYKCETDFINAINSKNNLVDKYTIISSFSSEFGKIKSNPQKIYNLLNNIKNSIGKEIQEEEINVLFVSQVNILVLLFDEHFQQLINRFYNVITFWEKADRYHYVRNKLSHPGCKTLEKSDLDITLDFIETTHNLIKKLFPQYYWTESFDNIDKQIISLVSIKYTLPLEIENFSEMPFSDMRLVCRENEINEIKNFVYGKKGALRKKTSYCIFGYGGLGKTALVLEAIKHIVRDIIDDTTINSYSPSFILFFSAKNEALNVSSTSGKIEQIKMRSSFFDFESFKRALFAYLNIQDFSTYNKNGLIIIDNFETLDQNERIKIKEFIDYEVPSQVQFIITSRNEENFEERKLLYGFSEKENCKDFIEQYTTENNIDLLLSDEEIFELLDITKGNTLVLVLCIKRLAKNFDTIYGLKADLTQVATMKKIDTELKNLPANGYEIISEYMFKNTFEEIINAFSAKSEIIYSLLRILAVYPGDYVDVYTLSLLSKQSYQEIDPIITLLCKFLIVEKKNNEFSLNSFAEKYIVFKLLPDKENYLKISSEIEASTRQIKAELRNLQEQINNNKELKKIISEWAINTEGDRIAAAKVFKLYGDVKIDCHKSKFFIQSAYDETEKIFQEIERSTMHPYVKYQKARIYTILKDTHVLDYNLAEKIKSSYQDCIWIIKTNNMFSSIRKTKTYASILWLFGMQLNDLKSDKLEIVKYLEESCDVFDEIKVHDNEYYQCFSYMGRIYLDIYEETRVVSYLKRARTVSDKLFLEKHNYDGVVRGHAKALRNELRNYIPNL